MIFFLAMSLASARSVTRAGAVESTGEHRTRLDEIVGRIDAKRHAVNDRDVDAHAGVERTQLLELLALFVNGRRQFDKPLQRGAAVSIKADVMIMRAGTMRVGAREPERA